MNIQNIKTIEDLEQFTQENKSPLRAIKAKCYECSAYSLSEVSQCEVKSCPLYHFRHGKNPFRKPRVLTEEQKRAAGERLKQSRKTS